MAEWAWECMRLRGLAFVRSVELGWYATLKQFLHAPLLDTTVDDHQLAQWIDEHTMTVHRFLPQLHRVRRTGAPRQCPADGDGTATPAPMWELVEDKTADKMA